MIKLAFIFMAVMAFASCTAPGQVSVNTPQNRSRFYPPSIQETPERRQALQDAWKSFITEFQLPDAKPELEPVINTPRSLPEAFKGRININTKGGAFDEMAAKQALRRFIERSLTVLSGGSKSGPSGLNELSLASFSTQPGFYRATFRQMVYPLQIAGGFGEMTLIVGKDGILSQWSSRLIPTPDLPIQPEIAAQSIIDKFTGREFTYTSIAGQPMSYKVATPGEIAVRELVVYPKLEGDILKIHLAYRVEAGRGTAWTVFVDAINGEELEVKQNFAT